MIADEADARDDPDAVGACPACGATIPPAHVLIEYEADGDRRLFADCPGCRDVVDPHGAARRAGETAPGRDATEE